MSESDDDFDPTIKNISMIWETVTKYKQHFFHFVVKFIDYHKEEVKYDYIIERRKLIIKKGRSKLKVCSNNIFNIERWIEYDALRDKFCLNIYGTDTEYEDKDDERTLQFKMKVENLHGYFYLSITFQLIKIPIFFQVGDYHPQFIILKNLDDMIEQYDPLFNITCISGEPIECVISDSLEVKNINPKIIKTKSYESFHLSRKTFIDGIMLGGPTSVLFKKLFPISSILETYNLIL